MAQLQTTGVTGSLTVTGQIIAQSLNVQQVTSSIVYSSGSNRFGSLTSNVQEFTGSLRVTGSGNHWIVGGNVGIDTSAPGAKFEVYNGDIWLNAASSAVNPEIRFIDDSGIGTAGAKIRYGNADGNLYVEHVYNTTNSGIFFRNRTAATALNTLSLVNGNVGIGSIAPAVTLDVNGNVRAVSFTGSFSGSVVAPGSNTQIIYNSSGVLAGSSNFIFDGGNVGIGTTSITPFSNLFAGRLVVEGGTGNLDGAFLSTNNTNAAELILSKRNPTNNFGSLLIQHSGSLGDAIAINYGVNMTTGTGGTNSFKVTTGGNGYFAGNVGIGTTSPGSKLTVIGDIATSTRIASDIINGYTGGSTPLTIQTGGVQNIIFGTNGAERIRLTPSGSFLVGDTVVPSETAWFGTGVFGKNATNKVIIGYLGSSTNGAVVGGHNSALNAWADLNIAGTNIIFRSSETEHMRLGSTGNVGIGTTNPSLAKLQVSGNIHATSFTGSFSGSITSPGSNTQVIYNSSGVLAGSSNFVFDGTNVGIGATSPIARLHVGPNLSDYSTYSFTNTGAVIASFGVDNTAARTNVLSLMRDGTSGVVYAGLAAFDLSRWSADSVNARTQLDIRLANTDTNTITDVISLRSNGCIGIGTTAPRDVLDIVGSAILRDGYNLSWGNTYGAGVPTITGVSGSSAVLAFFPAGSTSAEKVRFDANGNVGIGTTAPNHMLDITTNKTGNGAGSTIRINRPDNTSYENAINWATNGSSTWFLGSDNDSTDNFYLYNWRRSAFELTILSGSGNIGINTTAPTRRLDVNGTSIFRDFTTVVASNGNSVSNITWLSTDSGIMNIYTGGTATVQLNSNGDSYFNGGNLGIGTTAPLYKLAVRGSSNNENILHILNSAGSVDGDTTNIIRITANNNSLWANARYDAYDHIWYGNNSEKMRLTAAGNVGIGTSNPGAKLDVYDSNTTSGDRLIVRSAADNSGEYTGIMIKNSEIQNAAIRSFLLSGNSPNSRLGLFTGDNTGNALSEKFSILSNGYIGIGTTTPNRQLTFASINEDAIQIRRLTTSEGNTSLGTGISWTWRSDSTDNETWAAIRVIMPGNSNSNMTFSTTPALGGGAGLLERMRIQDNGNVGIGTTSAAAKLEVAGTWKLGDISGGSFKSFTFGTDLDISGNTTGGWARAHRITTSDTTGTVFFGVFGGDTTLQRAYWTIGDATSDSVGYITSNGINLLKNGNVGIGTTVPGDKLDVLGDVVFGSATERLSLRSGGIGFNRKVTTGAIYDSSRFAYQFNHTPSSTNTSDYLALQVYSGSGANITAEALVVNGLGNVGVGRTPSYKLDVNGDTRTFGYLIGVDNTAAIKYVFTNDGGNSYINSGNVGIGTTSPSQKLEIAGNISLTQGGNRLIRIGSATNYYYDLASSGDDFVINEAGTTTRFVIKFPNGNVGIGTNNPTTKLQVAGVISGSAFQLGPVQYAARRYTNTVENITTGSYTTLFNVYGDQLSSAVKVVIRGTVNSVVVDSIIDITANHFEDIVVKSQSGIYTILTIKILAATSNTEDFTVQAKINSHEPGQPLQAYVDVYPYGNEIIEFNPGSIYSTTVLEHECSPGFNHSSVGGTDYFNINNGNVGIGTTSPNATLNIVTPSDDTTGNSFVFKGSNAKEFVSISKLGFIRSRASDTNGANMHFFDNAGSKRVEVAVTSTDFSWYSDALSTTFMTFKHSNGYIGIGTTSPTATLQVVGNARIGQYADTSTNAVLDLTSGGSGNNSYIDFGYYGTFDAAIWFAGYFGDSSGQFKIRDASSGTATDAFVITQGSRNITIGSLSGTGNRIVGADSNGLLSSITVGSGLSLSGGTLTATGGSAGTVTGTGASTQIAYWTSTSNVTGSSGLVFSGGNVGIGTTSPGFTLDAQGGGSGLRVLSNTSYVDLALSNTSTTSYIQAESNNLRFFVAGGSNSDIVMLLDGTNDRVGIGTLTPTGKLQINSNNTPSISGTDPTGALVIKSTASTALTFGVYEFSPFYGWLQMRHGTIADIPYPLSLQPIGGNVGIGTTTPEGILQVHGTLSISNNAVIGQGLGYGTSTAGSSTTLKLYDSSTGDTVLNNQQYNIQLQTAGGSKITILNGGNVGIGTTSPSANLDIKGAQDTAGQISLQLRSGNSNSNFSSNQITFGYANTAEYRHAIKTRHNGGSVAGNAIDFYVWTGGDAVGTIGTTRVMSINGTSVGIGTSSPAYTLDVSGTIRATGDVIAYSDARVKDNVKTIENALEKITSLRGVSYTRKDTDDKSLKIGVIAQEVLPIIPEVVSKDQHGNYSVSYGNIVGLLIEAVKEQQKQIDELKYLLKTNQNGN
jgi:hypothetical protein